MPAQGLRDPFFQYLFARAAVPLVAERPSLLGEWAVLNGKMGAVRHTAPFLKMV